jgi:hypothetical protein
MKKPKEYVADDYCFLTVLMCVLAGGLVLIACGIVP